MMAGTLKILGLHVVCCAALCSIACGVEKNDRSIAEHGVTAGPSSAGETLSPLETSTSTTMGTSGATEDTGQMSASGVSMTGGEASGPDTVGSSSGTTAAPGPICGDGVVEGSETCDDGNDVPDDGCQYCAKDSTVFVSSEIYQGFAIGGLYGADQRCRSLAAKAELPRFETYRAWLSTPAMAAADRLIHSPGRYKLVNGLIVAADWEALTTAPLKNPIMVDEYSQTQDYVAWTGTLASGQAAPGSSFCGEWDDDSGMILFGGAGFTTSVDATWSFFEDVECGTDLHLYCVEQ
jgi:cysteine-rich repeat protein